MGFDAYQLIFNPYNGPLIAVLLYFGGKSMRLNIFTAIPLGVYLHKVETTKKGGWEENDEFIQNLGKSLYENMRKCCKTMSETKSGSKEHCRAAFELAQNRGGDIGLDLMLLTNDVCNIVDSYKLYVKNYTNSKK